MTLPDPDTAGDGAAADSSAGASATSAAEAAGSHPSSPRTAPGSGRPPRPSASPSSSSLRGDFLDGASSGQPAEPFPKPTNDSEGEDAADADGGDLDAYDLLDAEPLHLNTLRAPARLHGRPSRSRSGSRSRSRASSRSASPSRGGGGGSVSSRSTSLDRSSHRRSKSSGIGTPAEAVPGTLETMSTQGSESGSDIDPDILLDRLGFDDLDPHAQDSAPSSSAGTQWTHSSSLSSVNERMSDDSLLDDRAFQDLVVSLHKHKSLSEKEEDKADALGDIQECAEEEDEDADDKDEAGDDGNGPHGVNLPKSATATS